MIGPPPKSTLFPYPTLSRSPMLLFSIPAGAVADRLPKRRVVVTSALIQGAMGLTLTALVATGAVSVRDRKSTRLNSSHDQISYAVFCLKKTKNQREPETRWR